MKTGLMAYDISYRNIRVIVGSAKEYDEILQDLDKNGPEADGVQIIIIRHFIYVTFCR